MLVGDAILFSNENTLKYLVKALGGKTYIFFKKFTEIKEDRKLQKYI